MKQAEILKNRLMQLVDEANTSPEINIQFNQQRVVKEHMSITGGNGRLYITPSVDGYDISLSGISIEKKMYAFMRDLCGKECDGYKQLNKKIGKENQPFWRVSDFKIVATAIYQYAKTKK